MADKKHPEATRKWIADLVQSLGPRGAVAAGIEQGKPFSLGMANRCHQEFYGQAAAAQSPPAAAPPPPPMPPHPDKDTLEMLGSSEPEVLYAFALREAAGMLAGQDTGMKLRVLERVERVADKLVKLRKERQAHEAERRRNAILILPVEDP